MTVLHAGKSVNRLLRGSTGFTLVEVILAFTIVSVALGIFISMFLAAVRLAAESRDKTIAAEIAESYLNVIVSKPEAYTWLSGERNPDGLFEIEEKEGVSGMSSIPPLPDTTLATRSAHEKIISLSHKFRCRAWGRLSSAAARAVEVTVCVSWYTQGRPIRFALTSSVPRMLIDEEPGQSVPNSEAAP